MINDIRALKEAWNDEENNGGFVIYGGFMTLLCAIPAMIWRIIIGFVMIVMGIAKSIKKEAVGYRKFYTFNNSRQYEKCPKCGTELTYYNHFPNENEEVTSFVVCKCGYDSRNNYED